MYISMRSIVEYSARERFAGYSSLSAVEIIREFL